MKVTDKAKVLTEYVKNNGLKWSELLFMGDDIPDREVMKMVRVACCPNDAVQEIKDISAYISHLNGGFGCGRDVIEKVMKMRGNWKEDTQIPST
jgi:3-deoxy-D-manno-octulosonate 8-phosphate phosphatase (KDO 8-P phosphatase)